MKPSHPHGAKAAVPPAPPPPRPSSRPPPRPLPHASAHLLPASALAPHLWVPAWPAPPHVHALCSTREGGVSVAPFHSMNLGLHVGDDPAQVQTNRQLLGRWLAEHQGAATAVRPVFLDQVHGTDILALDAAVPDGAQADGAVTGATHLACTVLVADCLPVLLCNARGTRVAAVHAGWRGLVGQGGRGVLEAAAPTLLEEGPAAAGVPGAHHGTLAWLGPCIGPRAFEVGEEVRAAFVAADARAQSCFAPVGGGKWLANLPALARQRLQALGIERVYGNDGSARWCTVSNASSFFSYRRDRGTGRMAACIWRGA